MLVDKEDRLLPVHRLHETRHNCWHPILYFFWTKVWATQALIIYLRSLKHQGHCWTRNTTPLISWIKLVPQFNKTLLRQNWGSITFMTNILKNRGYLITWGMISKRFQKMLRKVRGTCLSIRWNSLKSNRRLSSDTQKKRQPKMLKNS